MAKNINVVSITDTFQVWLSKTNEIVNLINNDIMTASANGDITIGDAVLTGNFQATNLTSTANIIGDYGRVNRLGLPATTGNTYLNVESPTKFRDTSAEPLIVQNSGGPKISIRNNTANWQVGLLGSSASAAFSIGTSGGATSYLTISSTGVVTTTNSINSPNFIGEFAGDLTGNVVGNLAGNVTGNVTGNLTGDASHAVRLKTARNIALSGDVTGTASFNGTSNITINASVGTLDKQEFTDYISLIGASTSRIFNSSDAGKEQLILRSTTSSTTGASIVVRGNGDSSSSGTIHFYTDNSLAMTVKKNGDVEMENTVITPELSLGDGWTIEATSSYIYFKKDNNTMFRFSNVGALEAKSNITAFDNI